MDPSRSASQLAPLPQPDIRRISLRWDTWEAKVLIGLAANDEIAALGRYRHIHDAACRRLLALSIPWRTIIRGELDSPLWPESKRDMAITLALGKRHTDSARVRDSVAKRFDRIANSQPIGDKI